MTILIWVFSISAVLLIIMISYRGYELSSGKRFVSDEKRSHVDDKTLRSIGRANLRLKKMSRSVKNSLIKVSEKSHIIMHNTWVRLSGKVDRYFDKLRGRHGTGKRGIISLYYQGSNKKK